MAGELAAIQTAGSDTAFAEPPLRIGVVSPYYDPETGSAAVPGAICRALAAQGHEVHVLTGFPSYPTGRIYPGYRLRWKRYEQLDGVHVHRVALLPSHDRSALRRIATYLSFGISASIRLKTLRAADAWLVVLSQAPAALPAIMARLLFRRPYLLLVQDLWPQTVIHSGFVGNRRLLAAMVRGIDIFCDYAYRHAASVAVTAPGMAKVIARRAVAEAKLIFVPNWVDELVFRPVPADPEVARRLGLSGFVVMYAGNLGDLQGLETAIAAVRQLADLSELQLVLVGSGVAEQRLRQAASGLANVLFLGHQSIERLPGLMALSDVQLVSLKDLPLFRTTLPSKLQAAMACARPILGSVTGDAARIITRSGAGLVAAPGDVGALAGALRQLYRLGRADRDAMGRRGREFYLEHLAARPGAAKLRDLVQAAIKGARHERG